MNEDLADVVLLNAVSGGAPLHSKITDGTTDVVIDPYVNAIPVIQISHQQTHLGNMYVSGHRWTAVANDAYCYMSVTVPTGYVAHMTYEITGTGKAYVDLYEGATVTGGTSITPANKNRRSANTSHITVKYDVTVSNAGTLIPQDGILGAGDKNSPAGGGNGLDNEFVLASNTTYLLAVQNKSGGANDFSTVVLFYEKAVGG